MNEIEEIKIENLIYEIRGKQVMVDSDLAKLYGCKNGTKEINQAVKNNKEKFPERYSFILENDESLENKYGGRRYNIRVFTEQGIAMLATILKSKNAIQVSIRIMDTFVAMRNFINENKDIFKRLTTVEYEIIECKDKISELFDSLESKKIEK